ncbi:unnamed protein product, partial [Nesidiocoris tenuis]
MPEFRLIVSSIYLPSYQPTDHLEAYINQLESVSLKHPGFNLIAIGDFNLPGIHWDSWNNNVYLPAAGEKAKLLTVAMRQFDVKQFNFLRNQSNNILDLCFSNLEAKIQPADSITRLDPAHPPFLCTLMIPQFQPFYVTPQFTFNFKKGNYTALDAYFSSVDWNDCAKLPLARAIAHFYDTVHKGIESFVPRIKAVSYNFPKWFSKELIQLVKEKRYAHSR